MMTEAEHLRISFVRETRDLLEEANDALLALEADPREQAAINGVFRAVHTIKGSAGLFDLPALIHLVHAAEDLLGTVREGSVVVDSALTDDLLAGLDLVGRWIDQFEADDRLPDESGAIARDFAARYRRRLPGAAPAMAAAAEVGGKGPPDWLDLDSRRDLASRLADGPDAVDAVTFITYLPAADCFFSGEDPLFLVLQVPGLAWLKIEPVAPWPAAVELDPYVANLSYRMVATAPVAEIEYLFRYVPNDVVIDGMAVALLADGGAGPMAGGVALSPMSVEILLAQRFALEREPGEAHLASITRVLGNLLAAEGRPGIGPLETPAAGLVAIERLLAVAPATPASDRPARRTDPAVPAERDVEVPADKILRVEQGKVDLLMNLVGELVVAKNAPPFLAGRAETKYGSRELSREIKDQYSIVDRIAQDMQSAIMDIRMLPVAELFRRFPRLVRDVSRKLGKSVQLVIDGETTEADKNVIEALAEPLTHILRNSLDHGVESPEGRAAAGKTDLATISLRAYQEGDHVVIEIADDGKGINPEVVKGLALAKGLIEEARAAAMSDEEATQLVFLAGFSTAATVSDLSGRGVGMDAVRTVVERQGGTVGLKSVLGVGTTVRLRLPLSMAITRVMTVDVGGQLYGIPMDLVVETVRIPRDRLRQIKSMEAIVLREAVLPVVRLRGLLAMAPRPSEEEAVLVLRIAGAPLGIIVDEFRTGMDVILKPFAGILANMTGYAGTAVLGDGKVLLILNLKEML